MTGVLSDTAGTARLKAAAPIPLSPIGGQVLDDRKPTFAFQNAAGLFVALGHGEYRIELYRGDAPTDTIGVAADPSGGTGLAYSVDLAWDTAYTWRVRLEVEGAAGPWSEAASFSTPKEPIPEPVNKLGFVVPASCGRIANPMSNRLACAHEVSQLTDDYAACQAGSGVRCHRFTRKLAAALAVGDPNWGLITKNPGEQQCTWDSCGRTVSGGLGEDVVAYRYGPSDSNWQGYDVMVSAGIPGAHVSWNGIDGRRAGNNWIPVPPFP
ncbi:MAG: hypothetical protein Q8O42_09405 [Acidobacteriota bacterium]|nr:hypothetical protein [Acidobacteriota bacterium]